jgi:hypothetical protein
MTQDEIIEMARQAKAIPIHKDFNQLALIGTENIEAFAKLIAEKEREACAKLCEDSVEYAGGTLADAIRARGQA